jgi:hypothetical protein
MAILPPHHPDARVYISHYRVRHVEKVPHTCGLKFQKRRIFGISVPCPIPNRNALPAQLEM